LEEPDFTAIKSCEVRVVTRNKERALQKFGSQIDIFEGDVTNSATIKGALQDMDVVVLCLSAIHVKLIRKMKLIERDAILAIIDEAEKQNVSRLIYMSGYEMREDILHKLNIKEIGIYKIEVEKRIRASNLNWTILGDAPAFDLFFQFLRNNKVAIPGGGFKQIATISPEDVGEITAQAILRTDLGGQRLKLTGPQAISFPDFAELVSQITGKPVKHMSIPLPIVKIVSFLAYPITPFVRFIYKTLLLLNNFPEDLAAEVPVEHKKLIDLFDYKSVSIQEEIETRFKENRL
jgi:uncharacterized protein YbjT (DUF2867 family)